MIENTNTGDNTVNTGNIDTDNGVNNIERIDNIETYDV